VTSSLPPLGKIGRRKFETDRILKGNYFIMNEGGIGSADVDGDLVAAGVLDSWQGGLCEGKFANGLWMPSKGMLF
jgi:hypothetical protein